MTFGHTGIQSRLDQCRIVAETGRVQECGQGRNGFMITVDAVSINVVFGQGNEIAVVGIVTDSGETEFGCGKSQGVHGSHRH